jgi:heme/copper-type cytochrome/quinol oxidase subunit 2
VINEEPLNMDMKEWEEKYRYWKSGWFALIIIFAVILYWMILLIYFVFRDEKKEYETCFQASVNSL